MKYYRVRNPNWDGRNPEYQYRLVVVIEKNGEDHFATLRSENGNRVLTTEPVKNHMMVPAKFHLDSEGFHILREYYNCLSISAMEEVTEEQAKAEESININSGFGWLAHDHKESARQARINSGSATSRLSSNPSRHTITPNPFTISKGNIFGVGKDVGELPASKMGYFPTPHTKSTEEILQEMEKLAADLNVKPEYQSLANNMVMARVHDQTFVFDPDNIVVRKDKE